MTMGERFARILAQFGQQVVLRRDGTDITIWAFLQPVWEQREQAHETVTAIGAVDWRSWIYLGQEPLREGEELSDGTRRFSVRSCRPLSVGRERICYRAALRQAKEAVE